MRTREQVHQLIHESAAGLDVLELSTRHDRDAWLLEFDEETTIDVEFDAEADRLVLAAGVLEVPEARRSSIYELLLQFNFLWPQTGGVRMALDGMPGQVVMLFDLPDPTMGCTQLRRVLTNIAILQRSWRRILREIGSASDEGTPSVGEDFRDAVEHLMLKP
jgi:hypothetical protein